MASQPRVDHIHAEVGSIPLPGNPLGPLAEAWRAEVRVPRRRARVALGALVTVLALLVARQGTIRARLLAAVLLLGILATNLAWRWFELRLWRDPARVIQRLAGRIEPARAGRALRALSLLTGEDGGHGTSRELARLHVARSLSALPRERILEGAARIAQAAGVFAIGVGSLAAVVGTLNVWSLFEGADVLVARGGAAPLAMHWFVDLEVHARPPDYLHEEERSFDPFSQVASQLTVPRGTLLTIRGTPAHAMSPTRRLALSDGTSEVPFVDDGNGRLIARWPVAESVELRVVARFGEVVIPEPEATSIESVPDNAPVVTLEGAPTRVSLATSGGEDIPIRYEVVDDHGLREVHLVLRSGAREERRVLARLDGETRFDRGGHVLRGGDGFFRKSHAPVEVRVEAKDNDPITGPKWGASASITVIPPEVGEPEARRIDAFRKLRDSIVDTVASRLSYDPSQKAASQKAGGHEAAGHIAFELKAADDDEQLMEATLSSSYAGLRVAGRLQAMLRGQMRKLRDDVNREAKAATPANHVTLLHRTERLALVIDAIVRGLGQRDSRETAKQLADVADDLALGASETQRPSEDQRGQQRMDAAVIVLTGGSRSLLDLGSLGRDLGEIVTADLLRVDRTRKSGDLVHAEIAARDLAARLRQPDPSFGAQGRSGARAGGESGGGRGTPGEDSEGEDDAEAAFDMAAQDLEKLSQDHSEELGKVEQALSGAMSEEEIRQMTDETRRHAEAVRLATKDLPSVGAGSDSWTNKGAAAREHAEAMARGLEQGNPADAVTAGRSALDALDEAKRTAQRQRWVGMFGPARDPDSEAADKRLTEARRKLEPEVKWVEDKLEQLRKRAAERKAGELSNHGDEEQRLAERAQKLAENGRGQQALPEPALEALAGAEKSAREAASSLHRGEADKALAEQRDAQRQLEMAKEALGENNQGDKDHGDGSEREPENGHAEIPKAEAHKGPDEFRRRVIHGLGQGTGGAQKDAIRRYADGLLR